MQLNKIKKELLKRVTNYHKYQDILKEIPEYLESVIRLVFYRELAMTVDEHLNSVKIESFRHNLKGNLMGVTSPKPGTFELDGHGHAKIGDEIIAPAKFHKQTGSGRRKGTLLKRLTQNYTRGLELGTNIGLSGCYFLTNNCHLTTVEYSLDHCMAANQNLSKISNSFDLKNMTFDEAIDILLQEERQFDFLFLDGQHEEVATEHYIKRTEPLLSPYSMVIVDDIYWSEGMNNAWKKLIASNKYSYAIDLSVVGVLLTTPFLNEKTKVIDVHDFMSRPTFYNLNKKNSWWEKDF